MRPDGVDAGEEDGRQDSEQRAGEESVCGEDGKEEVLQCAVHTVDGEATEAGEETGFGTEVLDRGAELGGDEGGLCLEDVDVDVGWWRVVVFTFEGFLLIHEGLSLLGWLFKLEEDASLRLFDHGQGSHDVAVSVGYL